MEVPLSKAFQCCSYDLPRHPGGRVRLFVTKKQPNIKHILKLYNVMVAVVDTSVSVDTSLFMAGPRAQRKLHGNWSTFTYYNLWVVAIWALTRDYIYSVDRLDPWIYCLFMCIN